LIILSVLSERKKDHPSLLRATRTNVHLEAVVGKEREIKIKGEEVWGI